MYTVENQDRTIVIGSGIAGLSAALEIGKTGQDVVIFDQSRFASGGVERSEITHPDQILRVNAKQAISNQLYTDHFYVPERGLFLSHSVPDSYPPPVVSIDHKALLGSLRDQVLELSNVRIEEKAKVTRVSEDETGVTVRLEHDSFPGRFAVNASGAFGGGIEFNDEIRSRQFNQAIVAVAYGRRLHGKINLPDGEHAFLASLSTNGSGRSSWVIASGEDQIDVVWSDYARKDQAGKVINQAGKHGFQKLLKHIKEKGFVSVDNELGPMIGGIFGLEPRRTRSGNTRIFDHGERGQIASASVGDSIGPTLRLSENLAQIIANNGTVEDFEKAGEKVFDRTYETAILRTRLNATVLGRGTEAIIKMLETINITQQLKFLQTHDLPKPVWLSLGKAILHYPPIIRIIAEQAIELLKEKFRNMNEPLDPKYKNGGMVVSFE